MLLTYTIYFPFWYTSFYFTLKRHVLLSTKPWGGNLKDPFRWFPKPPTIVINLTQPSSLDREILTVRCVAPLRGYLRPEELTLWSFRCEVEKYYLFIRRVWVWSTTLPSFWPGGSCVLVMQIRHCAAWVSDSSAGPYLCPLGKCFICTHLTQMLCQVRQVQH